MPAGFGLLPSASLQPYGSEILKAGIGQLGTPIDVGAMLPKVAGPGAFQQKGAQRLADMYGMGDIQRDATGMVTGFQDPTGIASYQPYLDQISQQQLLDPAQGYKDFMSPYQKEIIDTTMQEYDIQAGRGRQRIRDDAYNVGAFGGARQGVEMGTYQSESDRNRAAILAGLYGQGYNQALTRRDQQLADLRGQAGFETGLEQQGIGALQALGAEGQALEQQKLNQLALGAQQGYQLPMQRIQDVSNIYGGIAGAMPGSPTQPFQPLPVATGIGGGLSAAYMLGMGRDNTQQAQMQGQYNTPPMGPPSIISDVRLKEDISFKTKSPSGLNIYTFKYKGDDTVYEGVMAQEVPWASREDNDGYLRVDYSKVDVDFKKI
ncbi:uncharacterized protein METZ01_LOCUS83464 [marine metagenome]|uniref:Peptidase S74 domain-containing protein n=1 Tax=marine metagenome TaxID=408172 RepID=A0A381URA9_9ZZZZ